jgi:hypothetical protein
VPTSSAPKSLPEHLRLSSEGKCLAQEWQRDGRGLWAMRACRHYYQHNTPHDFEPWRYNVQPPHLDGPAGGARGEAETTAPERDARTPQSTGAESLPVVDLMDALRRALPKSEAS